MGKVRRKINEHLPLDNRTRKKLQRFYESGFSAYGSATNLAKASGLPLNLVKEFLHSKESYNLYHNATRKFKRQSVFAKHINDIWCMDLAFVEKLCNENNGIKYLLVCVDVFSRYIYVQPMKNKYATTTRDAFKKVIATAGLKKNVKNIPNSVWVDKGTEFAGEFKRFCVDKGITVYNTFSETKAAFAERAIRSLKRVLYRFMEEKRTYTYIHHLQDFVKTLNGRVNRSIGKAPSKVVNSDAIVIHHLSTNKKKLIKNKQPKFKVGDRVHISKPDLPFRKGYKPQFTRETFIINQIKSLKPVVTYEIKDLNGEIIHGKFYEAELILTLV